MTENIAKFQNHYLVAEDLSDAVHIVPADDLKPHTTSRHCKCKPEIQRGENYKLIVHYSYDGREFNE